MENSFSLKGKIMGQTPNQFIIIKSITIIFKCMPNLRFTKYNNKSTSVCLTAKEKLLVFFTLSHILIISLKGGNTALSSLFYYLHSQLSLCYSLFSLVRLILSLSLLYVAHSQKTTYKPCLYILS